MAWWLWIVPGAVLRPGAAGPARPLMTRCVSFSAWLARSGNPFAVRASPSDIASVIALAKGFLGGNGAERRGRALGSGD